MIHNYLKIAIRNLIKHKGFTFINIFGLATSMSICLLIILFIMDQDRKDEFNPNAHRIYRILTQYDDSEKERIVSYATSPNELGDLLKFNHEDIENTSQLVKTSGNVKFENRIFNFNGLYASKNFLPFFHYELVEGSNSNALSKHNSAIISTELARKLFGDAEVLGQLVSVNGESFSITGTIDNTIKSHIEFDLILSIDSYLNNPINKMAIKNWDASYKRFYNYIKLDQDATTEGVEYFLTEIESKFSQETKSLYSFGLQRLDQINLGQIVRNEIGITTPSFIMYFFMVLALVVMLSASFNYMNLSIARALKRAREVGVRKIVGANKKHIIFQFLIESQIVMLGSMVLGILLLEVLVPVFNELKVLRDIDGAITMDFLINSDVYIVFILFSVGIGLVSGIYPALYLSSFKSLSALKGKTNNGKPSSLKFRKVLVFLQYSFSVIFIITTIVIYEQADVFVSADYGFTRENIMNVQISGINHDTFRDELLKRNEIKGVSVMSALPVLSAPNNIYLNTTGSQELVKTATFSIDPYTIDNLGLSLHAGRNFGANLNGDRNNAMILNKSAVEELGFDNSESAIGEVIEVKKTDISGDHVSKGRIIGVVDDFLHQFIFIKSGSLAMFYNPDEYTVASIKYHGHSPHKAALAVEGVWDSFENTLPFEYELYDYQISDIDSEFKDLVYIVGLVAFLAIVIACLGQFSMVIQHIQLKVKEIGIRKVLGSNVSGLMFLLSKDFLAIILLAIAISTPLAWKLNVAWTSKLALHTDVSLFNLSIGIMITLILSVSTIFFLVSKAAHSNPVDSLKHNG